MNHRFQCLCGALKGEVSNTHKAIHGVCYCKDCRTYAHHLGKSGQVLDKMNGTDVVATLSRYVAFTGGSENLGCLSLSEKGLLRWYAKCCNTPIANTTRNWKLPYVGLVHTCLEAGAMPLESSFPPIQMHLNVRGAKGNPPSMGFRTFVALLGFVPRLLVAKAIGGYKHTPFFNQDGSPRVAVSVLSREERERAMRAV